jgi:hypothetical protein
MWCRTKKTRWAISQRVTLPGTTYTNLFLFPHNNFLQPLDQRGSLAIMTLSGLFLLTVFYGVGALAGGAKLKGGNAGGKFLVLIFV